MVSTKFVVFLFQVDQDHVETVIPAVGRRVRVVNGMHRGETGVLLGLNEKSFSCSVELELRNGAGDRVSATRGCTLIPLATHPHDERR